MFWDVVAEARLTRPVIERPERRHDDSEDVVQRTGAYSSDRVACDVWLNLDCARTLGDSERLGLELGRGLER